MGVFHKYIADSIKEKHVNPCNTILSVGKVRQLLGCHNVPRQCQVQFIAEMQQEGLLKRNKRKNIEFLK